jgi:hypothetical protein
MVGSDGLVKGKRVFVSFVAAKKKLKHSLQNFLKVNKLHTD